MLLPVDRGILYLCFRNYAPSKSLGQYIQRPIGAELAFSPIGHPTGDLFCTHLNTHIKNLSTPLQILFSSLWSSALSVVKKHSGEQTLPIKPFNLLKPIESQRLSTPLSKIRVHLCKSVSQFLIPSHRLPQIKIKFMGIWEPVKKTDNIVVEYDYYKIRAEKRLF
jgi:hypothetical protein